MTRLVTKNNESVSKKIVTTNVDSLTGEILSSNTEIVETKYGSYDQFVQVYLDDMKGLMRISSKSEFWVTLTTSKMLCLFYNL